MKYVTYVWYDLEVKIVIVDGIMLVNKASASWFILLWKNEIVT